MSNSFEAKLPEATDPINTVPARPMAGETPVRVQQIVDDRVALIYKIAAADPDWYSNHGQGD